MSGKGQSGWDQLRHAAPKDTIRNRDVYNEQDLVRGDAPKSIKATSRNIACVIAGAVVGTLAYLVASFVLFVRAVAASGQGASMLAGKGTTLVLGDFLAPGIWNLLFGAIGFVVVYLPMKAVMKRNLAAQNSLSDASEINSYKNDQHVQFPEEVQRTYDVFPDVGAHSSVSPSTLLSHTMLTNKGVNPVKMTKRYGTNVLDADGEVDEYAGEPILDADGDLETETRPMFDKAFGQRLFDASGNPRGKAAEGIDVFYDPSKILYNPGGDDTLSGDREKLKGYSHVSDLINGDWELPPYETQRPAGMYSVDSGPVNTMVLAITRAGKGQTYIEPYVDSLLRQKRHDNIVCNDPKGELLQKFYVPAMRRGMLVNVFNLINNLGTDIENPLVLAVQAAREGNFTSCAAYVTGIASVFFPLEGGDDPVWPNAANNAFKRAVYALMDYYLEEEHEMREDARSKGIPERKIEGDIDRMWGKVTLYNCYEFFVQLTSKTEKNPIDVLKAKDKAEEGYINAHPDEVAKARAGYDILWRQKAECDLSTLFFNATAALPQSGMRRLVNDANAALESMAGAEKMMASVYGIAITAMSFFADPTIYTMTSGAPSQNVDLAAFSFPRMLGVRFDPNFCEHYHLIGLKGVWDAYDDQGFTQKLDDKEFSDFGLVTSEGWIRYAFDGKFPHDSAYLRLRIVNPSTGVLVKTFWFKFTKAYMTSLDGRTYKKDPINNVKVVRGGIMQELIRSKGADGTDEYHLGHRMFKQIKIRDFMDPDSVPESVPCRIIMQNSVRYTERAQMLFMVTPPHLMEYAKLILIILTQLVNLNFDQSYRTKANQKPLYKTRYVLDELGNLQSEGHGINNFQTMLSIGLGQDQYFTLILQTLQQLRDVYGESSDKIIQGNVGNIIFLKSTDDSMLDTLVKMGGTTHVPRSDSRTVTRDLNKIVLKNEGKVSINQSTREEPVIQYNDLAFIPERNSVVFRAGDSPIWNRNQTILPMSFCLLGDTIKNPEQKYTFETIPTMSSAKDFSVKRNQPDFISMLHKREEQALATASTIDRYKQAYGCSDYDISQKDEDDFSKEIMAAVNRQIKAKDESYDRPKVEYGENPVWKEAQDGFVANDAARHRKIFAGGHLAPADLVGTSLDADGSHGGMVGKANHAFDKLIVRAFLDCRASMEHDSGYFSFADGVLCDHGGVPFIRIVRLSADRESLVDAVDQKDKRVFSDEEIDKNAETSIIVTDEFIRFLAGCEHGWTFANGAFERSMADQFRNEL